LDEGRGEFKYVTPTKLTELRSIYKNRSWLPYYSLEGSDILLTGPTTDSRQSTGPIPPSSPNEGHLWSRTGSSPGLYVWHVDPTSSQWVQLTAEQAVDATASTSSINLVLDYHREIPDYKAVDASWVEDEYFDLYLYTVCKHAAPYLREDVRLPTWLGLQVDALDSANEESAFYQERAIPQERPLPRQAGISRRRR
jgi:hypothetical protein